MSTYGDDFVSSMKHAANERHARAIYGRLMMRIWSVAHIGWPKLLSSWNDDVERVERVAKERGFDLSR
jgi:hypothetical protein